jgi:hypothetical protein
VAPCIFLRGLSAQVGIGRPMAAPLRYLSYSVDTVLLAAALTLIAVPPSAVFANGRLVEILSLVSCTSGLAAMLESADVHRERG